jgi:4-aminobutyrate--pyruvate transaminase
MRTLPYYHSFSGKVPGPVTELVAKLIDWAPTPALRAGRLLFANSGSESNDTAFKLVRYYHNARNQPLKKKIIARAEGLPRRDGGGRVAVGPGHDAPAFRPAAARRAARVGTALLRQRLPGESEAAFVDRLVAELEALIAPKAPRPSAPSSPSRCRAPAA